MIGEVYQQRICNMQTFMLLTLHAMVYDLICKSSIKVLDHDHILLVYFTFKKAYKIYVMSYKLHGTEGGLHI